MERRLLALLFLAFLAMFALLIYVRSLEEKVNTFVHLQTIVNNEQINVNQKQNKINQSTVEVLRSYYYFLGVK